MNDDGVAREMGLKRAKTYMSQREITKRRPIWELGILFRKMIFIKQGDESIATGSTVTLSIPHLDLKRNQSLVTFIIHY